jgi:hypothetical protein
MLRVELWNDIKGQLIIETADPIGLNDMPLNIKRDAENEGVTYEVTLDFEFIEEGRMYVADAFETCGGPDAEVTVKVYELNPNTYKWTVFTEGQIDFKKYDLSEDRVVVNIEQTGFQRRTLNLLEVDVNLETTVSQNGTTLPANPGVYNDVLYHSKAILKEYDAKPTDSTEYQQIDVLGEGYPQCLTPGGCVRSFDQTAYGQVDFGEASANELEGVFQTPYGYSTDGVFPVYQAVEAGLMDLDIQLRLKHSVEALLTGGDIDFCGSGTSDIGQKEVFAWFRHTDSEDVIITETDFGQWTSNVGCGDSGKIGNFETKIYANPTLNINVGDKLYVYFTFRISGNYEQNFNGSAGRVDYTLKVQADPDQTWLRMTQTTQTADSTVKTILLYEAMERCCQYYTNQVDCFRSTLIGRTDIIRNGVQLYPQDGQYGLIGITNGHFLRALAEGKTIISSLRDLLDFINSVACVGFGFETVDGVQVLRLEKREYFYRKNLKILSLSSVADIHKKIDTKRLYNQIEYGYAGKLDIGQVNAIDEFNTLRRQIIPVIQTKNQLKIASTMRVSGYQIEFQRRLAGKTVDSKLDDENFAVVLVRDGSTFKTKKNEGYSFITGVYDFPSGYNYDISPARNYENWLPFVASSLIRSFDKTTKFTYGEVNYTAATQKTTEATLLPENGDRDLSMVEPFVDYMNYSFTHPLTREELQLIRLNPYGYIEFTDLLGTVMQGFISAKGIEYNKEEGTADFDLIRVYRKVL